MITREPTKAEKERYIDRMGQECPNCGSGDLEMVGGTQSDCDYGWEKVVCNTCGKQWNDIYKLIGFEWIEEE